MPPPPPNAPTESQQIKSMLADAAVLLQQAMPSGQQSGSDSTTTAPVNQPATGTTQDSTGASSGVTPGTPVTLASLNAQLESLRSMTRDFGVRAFRTLEEEPKIAPVALLDSGATHAVIPYSDGLRDLDSVPVTLAGDSKEEWWKTRGGTLVIPPTEVSGKAPTDLQTILPLGGLVENLGCSVTWNKRSGLKVQHPVHGVLKTGVGKNTCPFIQEDQALKLISELEDCRLKQFEEQIQNLQTHLDELEKPIDPTEALRMYMQTGTRQDAMRAVMAQPYLADLREDLKAMLAEGLPGLDDESGKKLLKVLPLNRHKRRELLSSERWVVHLGSGPRCPHDPLLEWCKSRGLTVLNVDVREQGGKGWTLTKAEGVWRALLWAAASGRIAMLFSSPPKPRDEGRVLMNLQPLFLWSLSSVAKGGGIPYLHEQALVEDKVPDTFVQWSNGSRIAFQQCNNCDALKADTKIMTNLDLGYLSGLVPNSRPAERSQERGWTAEFRHAIIHALEGKSPTPAVEHLDKVIAKGLRASCEVSNGQLPDLVGNEEKEYPHQAKELSAAQLEQWKKHVLAGHLPFRRDCKFCIEGAATGPQHRRIPHPQSYTLSIDLFGPVPPGEHGRDETSVSGKTNLKYGLVAAFRVPRSAVPNPSLTPDKHGIEDLYKFPEGDNAEVEDDLAEYEPSLPDVSPEHEQTIVDQDIEALEDFFNAPLEDEFHTGDGGVTHLQ